ncbi:MAG: ankyrin repeat domain-containing protein [Alphaproteobacteria bacterium]|nr:ankyrin repeat domain-containing protein [Alphaproteobacteria bacterium]
MPTNNAEARHRRTRQLGTELLAAQHDTKKCLDLISQGIDINGIAQSGGMTPLHCAASKGDITVMKALLDLGADTEKGNVLHHPPLYDACMKAGSTAAARILLEHGAKADFACNHSGKTLLMLLARNSFHETSIDIARLLLDHGADVNKSNAFGYTALFYAAEEEQHKDPQVAGHMINVLLERGADIEHRTWGERETPLLYALRSGYAYSSRRLLKNGANVNVVSDGGTTPLMSALCSMDAGMVNLLIKNSANMDAQDEHGDTALIIAAQLENTYFLETLLKNGAHINTKNKDGKTALDYALTPNHTRLILTEEKKRTAAAFKTAAARGTIKPRKIMRPTVKKQAPLKPH